MRKLQNYYMESLPLLQANFYSSLIDGRISKSDIPKYINDYQIDLTGPVLCCVDIHTSASEVPEGMSPLLLSMSVQREAQERLGKAWRARSGFLQGAVRHGACDQHHGDCAEREKLSGCRRLRTS